MAKRPSLGRQKIKIAKIEIKNHLQVTFSKRRSGLFKKASELCVLTGAEIAVIVFSPAGKVFSYGHPDVVPLVDRFLTRNQPPSSDALQLLQARQSAHLDELNFQLTRILEELETTKKRGDDLDLVRKANQGKYWWESDVDQLGLPELEKLRDCMEELKNNVTDQASRVMDDARNHPIFAANSSVNGAAGFDHYEHKPAAHINNMVASSSMASGAQNFGYSQLLF